VAERLGLAVAGVGMPGHFIVADLSGPAPRYLDPFAGWAELGEADCAALVRETSGLAFHPELLAPTAPRDVLMRMLANLRGSYLRRQALADVLWTAELGLLVIPGAEPLERELPVLLAAVGRYDDAERAATAYLAERADSPHRAAVEAQLAAVRDLKRRMN
jgi:regulator of sirC expression with transglutaminase-like and TPR domain